MDVLSTADIFHYPQFTYGKVFFKDGVIAETKLNYNRFLDEMHFINPKGDTLALTNEKTIQVIAIGKDSFYYDQGYVRLISSGNGMQLADKQTWKLADKRKTGAYNISSSVSSISSRSNYFDGRRSHNLNVKEDVVLVKVEQYYFGDKYNRFVLADKKNLRKLFPKEQERIDTYLKENKIDFDNKEDLKKIVQFLEQF